MGGADGTVYGRGLLLGAPCYGRGWIGWVRGEVGRVARGACPVWVLVPGERGRRTDGLMRGLVGPRARRGRGKAGTPWRPGLRWIPASGENLCPARTRPASPGPRPAEESWIPGHPRRSRWPLVLGSVPRCRLPGPCSPALPVSGPFPPRGFPGRSPLSPRPAGWNPRSSGKGTDPSFPERLRDSFHGRTGESLRVPCPRQPRSRSSLPRPGSSPFAGNREEPFRRSTGRSTGILPHPLRFRHQGGRASWRWASRP